MQSSAFQFKTPVMSKAVFQINEGYQKKGAAINMPAHIQTQKYMDENASSAHVEIEVTVGEQTEEYPFYVFVSYGADFRWEPGTFEGKRLDLLLSRNAPALLLGYARVAISTLTNFSPYPSYNLPFVDFQKNDAQT